MAAAASAAACSSLSSIRVIGIGSSPLIPNYGNSSFSRSFKYHPQRSPNCRFQATQCSSCLLGSFTSSKIHLSLAYATPPLKPASAAYEAARTIPFALQDASMAASDFMNNVALADLDPTTAKLAIGFLGPFLSAFSFLFIVRIVMSWYPKLPVEKFPYVIAFAPTEPLLIATRKVIPLSAEST